VRSTEKLPSRIGLRPNHLSSAVARTRAAAWVCRHQSELGLILQWATPPPELTASPIFLSYVRYGGPLVKRRRQGL
jgi:hypothetical protein